jgi:hypothetical protein
MPTPLFFPPPRYRAVLPLPAAGTVSVRELCAAAGVPCRASGGWTERRIQVVRADGYDIEAEPGGWGTVRIAVPRRLKPGEAYRHALAALAFGLMDLVARESIRGQRWARPAPPRGRPATGTAWSNAERQRAYRHRVKRSGRKTG